MNSSDPRAEAEIEKKEFESTRCVVLETEARLKKLERQIQKYEALLRRQGRNTPSHPIPLLHLGPKDVNSSSTKPKASMVIPSAPKPSQRVVTPEQVPDVSVPGSDPTLSLSSPASTLNASPAENCDASIEEVLAVSPSSFDRLPLSPQSDMNNNSRCSPLSPLSLDEAHDIHLGDRLTPRPGYEQNSLLVLPDEEGSDTKKHQKNVLPEDCEGPAICPAAETYDESQITVPGAPKPKAKAILGDTTPRSTFASRREACAPGIDTKAQINHDQRTRTEKMPRRYCTPETKTAHDRVLQIHTEDARDYQSLKTEQEIKLYELSLHEIIAKDKLRKLKSLIQSECNMSPCSSLNAHRNTPPEMALPLSSQEIPPVMAPPPSVVAWLAHEN